MMRSCMTYILHHHPSWELPEKQCQNAVHRLQVSVQHNCPHRLASKLRDLELNASLCNYVLDFLSNRPHVVRVGHHTSRQPSAAHPVHTQLCHYAQHQLSIVKLADDTVLLGLISNNKKPDFLDETDHLSSWFEASNTWPWTLGGWNRKATPLSASTRNLWWGGITKNLRVHLSMDLRWSHHIHTLYLRQMSKFKVSPEFLYWCFRKFNLIKYFILVWQLHNSELKNTTGQLCPPCRTSIPGTAGTEQPESSMTPLPPATACSASWNQDYYQARLLHFAG